MGQRIVITGAAGNVGRTVTEALAGRHTLTLLDRTAWPGREADGPLPVVRVELSDFAAVLDAMPAADAVVHLGANPDEAAWQDILTNNITATYNVFEVARRKGVRRIVFASTVMIYDGFGGRTETEDAQTSPGRPPGELLTPERHSWPTTRYAVSKRFGEELGKMYAREYGMSVVCIRLGWFPHLPIDPEAMRRNRVTVLGVEDCRRLFTRAVEAEGVEFGVVNGFSREGAVRFDLEPGRRLIGYEPQDDFETALASHAARQTAQ
jgi:nucleoside-diphosphate-sugar epimerase